MAHSSAHNVILLLSTVIFFIYAMLHIWFHLLDVFYLSSNSSGAAHAVLSNDCFVNPKTLLLLRNIISFRNFIVILTKVALVSGPSRRQIYPKWRLIAGFRKSRLTNHVRWLYGKREILAIIGRISHITQYWTPVTLETAYMSKV